MFFFSMYEKYYDDLSLSSSTAIFVLVLNNLSQISTGAEGWVQVNASFLIYPFFIGSSFCFVSYLGTKNNFFLCYFILIIKFKSKEIPFSVDIYKKINQRENWKGTNKDFFKRTKKHGEKEIMKEKRKEEIKEVWYLHTRWVCERTHGCSIENRRKNNFHSFTHSSKVEVE